MARNNSAPPLPPDVTEQQQQDPAAEFAQRNAGAASAGQQPQPDANSGMEFAKQKLASISNDLLEVAKVIAVAAPQLMPILTRMAGMGSQLDKMLAKDSQGAKGNTPSPANGAEPPQGSMQAPEAPGAMGV